MITQKVYAKKVCHFWFPVGNFGDAIADGYIFKNLYISE